MFTLETELLHAEFHPRGAAITRLIYKPFNRDLILVQADRDAPHHYANTVIGPVANRIAGAEFSIDNERFRLDTNENDNCLHGGTSGLSELEWIAEEVTAHSIIFSIEITNGHMGFPGPSQFRAIYKLDDNQLTIALEARSPRSNYFNLTPHFYFNLDGSDRIDGHNLQINADYYLPVDRHKIPLGLLAPVNNSDFDFRETSPIGTSEIDHNFCLMENDFHQVANLHADDLMIAISTDQLGLQIYTRDHANRSHLAIEPQGWPNAINEPHFHAPLCTASQRYQSRTSVEVNQVKKLP